MESKIKTMNDAELEEYLRVTLAKLEDAEDELTIIREQSDSGQHVSSKYFQSAIPRLEENIKSLNAIIENIKTMRQKR